MPKRVAPAKHGGVGTRLYRIYRNMIERCYYANNDHYARYGGRGISVCDEWQRSFASFRAWAMATGYSDKLTLDRIDYNGNYEPENCRWLSMKEQSNNKRNNRYVEYNGEVHTVSEWADIIGVKYPTLAARLGRLGWSVERALTTRPRKYEEVAPACKKQPGKNSKK